MSAARLVSPRPLVSARQEPPSSRPSPRPIGAAGPAALLLLGLLTPPASVWAGEPATRPADPTPQAKREWLSPLLLVLGLPSPPCPRPDGPAAAPGPDGWHEQWKRLKNRLREKTGTSVGLCVNSQSQVLLNGPQEGRARSVLWWNLGVVQELWAGGKLVVNARGGVGDGLGRYLGAKHNTNWAQDEPRALYVSHVLLEQKLLDEKLTLSLGKLDVGDYFDTNAAGDWTFLSYSLARNPTIPFVWHAMGAVACYEPCSWLYVQAGAADGRGSGTETGLKTAFHDEDHFLGLFEFGFRPKLGDRQGNYRFILWYDGRPVDRVDGNGSERDDVGFAVSFDQQVTEKVTAFLRYGFAHARLREIASFWSLGATWTGAVPQRPRDVLGFGVAQAVTGTDYRRANGAASTETIVELYYRIRVNEWLSVTPDLQAIVNPGARNRDVGVVAGVGVNLSF